MGSFSMFGAYRAYNAFSGIQSGVLAISALAFGERVVGDLMVGGLCT
jgi:hypothetical protein